MSGGTSAYSVYRKEDEQGRPVGFDWPLLAARAALVILAFGSFGAILGIFISSWKKKPVSQPMHNITVICQAPEDQAFKRLEREIYELRRGSCHKIEIVPTEGVGESGTF